VRATDVPVGDDQLKHVELTRHLAKSFNHKFGHDVFPLPTALTGKSLAHLVVVVVIIYLPLLFFMM